jgi:hypothetical protein
MIAPFDLFRTQDDGSVKWLGVCADLEAAKMRVIELSNCLCLCRASISSTVKQANRSYSSSPMGNHPSDLSAQLGEQS